MAQKIKRLVILDIILLCTLTVFIVAIWFFPGTRPDDIEPARAAMCSTCNFCKSNGTNGTSICDPGTDMSDQACAQQCCRTCGNWSPYASRIGQTKNDTSAGECQGTRSKTCNAIGYRYGCYGGSRWGGWSSWDYSGSDGQSCDGGAGVCSSGACVAPSYVDIGLRIYDGTEIIRVAADPDGVTTSPIRISKNGTIYYISLVDVGDAAASKIRVQTATSTKALRKLN